jgi:hypothetical protein
MMATLIGSSVGVGVVICSNYGTLRNTGILAFLMGIIQTNRRKIKCNGVIML